MFASLTSLRSLARYGYPASRFIHQARNASSRANPYGPLEILVIDGYAKSGRQELVDNGATSAGGLYKVSLSLSHTHTHSYTHARIFSSHPISHSISPLFPLPLFPFLFPLPLFSPLSLNRICSTNTPPSAATSLSSIQQMKASKTPLLMTSRDWTRSPGQGPLLRSITLRMRECRVKSGWRSWWLSRVCEGGS